MGNVLDWARKEVEIACKKKKIQIEKTENLITAARVMKVR